MSQEDQRRFGEVGGWDQARKLPRRTPQQFKATKRADLIQALAEAIVDQVIPTTQTINTSTPTGGIRRYVDFTLPGRLEDAFDHMVASDDAEEWAHFKPITFLPDVIKAYRLLP
jgi:hypothetical protein